MTSRDTLIALFKEQLENESGKIASDNELEKRGDFLIWWYFLKLQGIQPTEIDEIVCDGGNDLGIDAIRIDDTNFVHFYQFKNPEAIESALPGGGVDKLLAGLRLILSRKHKTIANDELKGRIEEIYQIVPVGYRLHLVTSGTGMSEESREKLDAFVLELGGPSDDFFSWGLEDIVYLQDTFYQRKLPTISEPIVFTLERQAPYQVRSADHDSYIFHATGERLAELYVEHGEQLLQQNIRVFQGEKATNARIRQTCEGQDSANFIHFNNGVTFLCESAHWDQFISKLTLNKAQVVNGGQTIRVLHKAFRDERLKKDALAPVRVITSHGDKDFASDVAVNLNNQNRIESSFLRSNDPRIVQLSNSLESLRWYLERRENEVKGFTEAEVKAIERRIGRSLEGSVIRLKEATQAYVATYIRQPELAKKNPSKMFLSQHDGGFFDRIFNDEISAEKVVIAQRLKWIVDAFVQQFMVRKRRKARVEDWRQDYRSLLGADLVDKFGDELDQIIPQSSIFLCALLFEDSVVISGNDPATLVESLSKDPSPLIEKLFILIDFSKKDPRTPNKSWPTLLKSQSFFDSVASFLMGRVASAGAAAPRS